MAYRDSCEVYAAAHNEERIAPDLIESVDPGRGWPGAMAYDAWRTGKLTEDGCPNEVAVGGERQNAAGRRYPPSRQDAGPPLVRRRSRARRTPYPQSTVQVRRDLRR